jgi:hypothetical protein
MECWSDGIAVQGARRKVHGTEVKRLGQMERRIFVNKDVAVNRVSCTVSHPFLYSITPISSRTTDRGQQATCYVRLATRNLQPALLEHLT